MSCPGKETKMKKGISAVMIVENEVEFIQKCLDSIYETVDEVCVYLDCHSSDGTREVLEACDKVRIKENVYSRESEEFNFSKARNESLKMAKYSWSFYIDGDEVLKNDPKEVRKVILNAPENVVWLIVVKQTVNSVVPAELTQHRIFPTRKGVFYEGAVHNQIRWSNKELVEGNLDIVIDHLGYGSNAKHERRMERTKKILADETKRIEEEGASLVDYYNLVKMSMAIGDDLKAFEFVTDGLPVFMKADEKEQYSVHRFLLTSVRCMMRLGMWDGIRELLELHMKIAGELVDSSFLLFTYHYRRGEMVSAFLYGLKYLELLEIEQSKPVRFETTLLYKTLVKEKVNMLQIYLGERLTI